MPRVAPVRFRYRDCRCHRSVYLLTADAGVVRMSTYRVMGHLRRTRKVRRDLPQTRGVSDHPSIWLSFCCCLYHRAACTPAGKRPLRRTGTEVTMPADPRSGFLMQQGPDSDDIFVAWR